MITIIYTNEEVQTLGQLIDIAIKAGGIPNAKVGVPLFEKLENALLQSNNQEILDAE